jgi:hypothetical protein
VSTYAAGDSALFTEPRSELTHVLQPNMAWACGGNIVTKGGHIGWLHEWETITCPECLAFDREELAAESAAMQGRQA